MPVCAICRKERKREQLMDDRLIYKNRRVCQRIAANELREPTRAQATAKRLSQGRD